MQAYTRVLFISPSDSNLDVAPEADALAELGFTVRNLQGEVTAERIFAAVVKTQWDILHFAGDAGPTGFLLSGKKIFDVDAILQVAKMAKAKLVFINGCSSAVIGQILIDEGVPVSIVAMRDLKDEIAKQTAQAFYKGLAESGNLHEAYKASKPATRGLYQWLADGGYTADLLSPLMAKMDALTDIVEENSAHLESIATANAAGHAEFSRTIADLQGDMCTAHNLKRYFLRVTMVGWAVAALAFSLFVTIDKVVVVR